MRSGDKNTGTTKMRPRARLISLLGDELINDERVAVDELENNYELIATLTPPYAEALQECFSSFYGSVGIPDIDPNSIRDLIPEE